MEKSFKKKGFFLKQKTPVAESARTHKHDTYLNPYFSKTTLLEAAPDKQTPIHVSEDGKWKNLAAGAPVLTFPRFILNYISSEVKMLRWGSDFPSCFSLSQEMDLEAVVVGGH